MNAPDAPDGIFEGGILFDGCDYRTRTDIVGFRYQSDRLGIVRDRGRFFRAEFLVKRVSPQFSHPVWTDAEPQVVCGSVEKATQLIERFVRSPSATP